MHFRSRKLLRAAKDRPCVLCGSVGTTVSAHTNKVELGHGTGCKAPDFYVVWVCQKHHDEMDGRIGNLTKEERFEMWVRAYLRTVAIWFNSGLVRVA